jgi:hypothetical protein
LKFAHLAFHPHDFHCCAFAGQSDGFTYRMTDCNGNTAEASVTLNFQPQPIAKDDVYEYNGQPFTKLAAVGVLANDVSEGSDEPLTARLRAQAMNGFVSMSKDGAFTYSPSDTQMLSGGNESVQAASAPAAAVSTAETMAPALAAEDATMLAGEATVLQQLASVYCCVCCY